MTQLYYTPPSGSILSSLQIIDTNNQQVPLYYYDVTIATSSISIFIQSGSSTLGVYPVNNTDLYYPPFPTVSLPTTPNTSSFINIDWNFQINSADFIDSDLSGSGYSLVSGSTVYLTGSYSPNRGSTVITIPSTGSQTYTARVYGKATGGTYGTGLVVMSNQGVPPQNFITKVSGSSVSSSATFTMSPSSNYTMYFIVTGSSVV